MDIDQMRKLRARVDDWKRRFNAATADPQERHDAARATIEELITEREQLNGANDGLRPTEGGTSRRAVGAAIMVAKITSLGSLADTDLRHCQTNCTAASLSG